MENTRLPVIIYALCERQQGGLKSDSILQGLADLLCHSLILFVS